MTRCTEGLSGAFALGLVLALAASCAEQDDRPATFAYIHQAIIKPNCATASCHSELASTAGFSLERKDGAYQFLVGRTCDQEIPGQAPRNFVEPGNPDGSKLMHQLRGIQTRRMPPDVALPEVDIELIERWILEGAPCE